MQTCFKGIKVFVIAILISAVLPALKAQAHGSTKPLPSAVEALFSINPPIGPTPTDASTIADHTQTTGRRVNFPLPDCTVPSNCFGTQTINLLDGFNVQPRIAIPFSGPIDPGTVSSKTIFFVNLGSTTDEHHHGNRHVSNVVGVNQVVWNTLSNTLYAEADELLDEHTVYAMIVINGIRDTAGRPVQSSADFKSFRTNQNPAVREYFKELGQALDQALDVAHLHPKDVVVASVFTTESITAVLTKIRDQIKSKKPVPVDFNIGPGNSRAIFNLSDIANVVPNLQYQLADFPNPGDPPQFFPDEVFFFLVNDLAPGAVGKLAYGRYWSPNYLNPDGVIPAVGTRTGNPVVQGMNQLYFTIGIPSGPKPRHGWPIVVFGHGFGTYKDYFINRVVADMAKHGQATIAIDAVGHGWGPLSTLDIVMNDGSVITLPAPGRSVDQNGDGFTYGAGGEGFYSTGPVLVANRDTQQQTAADMMQLVREIQVGMDADGDGVADFDPSRIYYLGVSQGGDYGTLFLAAEPDVHVGVLNVPAGPVLDELRLQPDHSTFAGILSGAGLLNGPGGTYIDNIPFRNQPTVIDSTPGADAIQAFVEGSEWISASGESIAWAQHLSKEPLDGTRRKSVTVQFDKGDETVPNPITSALVRGGDLTSRTTYFRNDLFAAANPDDNFGDPHVFLVHAFSPATTPIALDAQEQVGRFFQSDGHSTINPDRAYFEAPIVGPLPETLNFLP